MKNELGLILMIEDNPDDFEATLRCIRKNHLDHPVQWCQSGQDAHDYLYQEGHYKDDPEVKRPLMIFLDLNMPGIEGRQFLKALKSDRRKCAIPVIVLTTSNDPRDIEECYALGASSYIQKPVCLEGLSQAMHTLKNYWFNLAMPILVPQCTV